MPTGDLTPRRGRVYMGDIGTGDRPWLVVSNDGRNRRLDDFVAVRITSRDKQIVVPTIIPLDDRDPLEGWVHRDDVVQMFRPEIRREVGPLTLPTMRFVNDGLRIALGL